MSLDKWGDKASTGLYSSEITGVVDQQHFFLSKWQKINNEDCQFEQPIFCLYLSFSECFGLEVRVCKHM